MKSLLLTFVVFTVMSCAKGPSGDPKPNEPMRATLPYVGEKELDEKGDTLYYQVPSFSFINQDSTEISHKNYFGHIYVTDFFFTTCPTICPIMSSQMSRLQGLLQQEGLLGEVLLLSHTVDPAKDSPQALKAYANTIGADLRYWNFVTGSEEELYYQAKNGYMINALPADTAPGGFIHSDNFVLVDRERHIRGYYDGTSTKDVDRLFSDIKYLIDASKRVN
jgi:protein SCO1/2